MLYFNEKGVPTVHTHVVTTTSFCSIGYATCLNVSEGNSTRRELQQSGTPPEGNSTRRELHQKGTPPEGNCTRRELQQRGTPPEGKSLSIIDQDVNVSI